MGPLRDQGGAVLLERGERDLDQQHERREAEEHEGQRKGAREAHLGPRDAWPDLLGLEEDRAEEPEPAC